MKKILSLLVILTLVTFIAGCQKKTTTKPAGDREKVLKLLETSNIPDMKSWTTTDQVSFYMLAAFNEGLLVAHDPKGATPYVAGAAKDWTVSADGLTYTFNLRQQPWVQADGTPYKVNGQVRNVMAKDFVFAWQKLADPREASQYNYLVETAGIVGGAELVALANTIDLEDPTADAQIAAALANLGVKATGDYTLEVKLNNAADYFVSLLSFPSFYPVCEEFYNAKGEDGYAKSQDINSILYNGAFLFQTWENDAWHILVKNPLYWDVASVELDKVIYPVKVGIEPTTSVQMYLDGEIDSVTLATADLKEQYGSRPDRRIAGSTTAWYLEFNVNNHPAGTTDKAKLMIQDVDVRRALSLAIDKQYYTDVALANGSFPADYYVPFDFYADANGNDFRTRMEQKYPTLTEGKYTMLDGSLAPSGFNHYNKAEALRLWNAAKAEYGVGANEEVVFTFLVHTHKSWTALYDHVKAEVEKNLPGAKLNVVSITFGEKLERAQTGDFDILFSGWGPDYMDPTTFLDLYLTGSGQNNGKYSNATFDKLVRDAKQGKTSGEERFDDLLEAEKILLSDDVVLMPIFQSKGVGLRNPKIQNLWGQKVGPDYILKWVDIAE